MAQLSKLPLTIRYCANFLKKTDCLNKDCLYLHYQAEPCDIIDKDDMNTDKTIFLSQHYIAIEIGNIFNEEKRKLLESTKESITFLPTPSTLYTKDIVVSYSKRGEALSFTNGNLFKTSKQSRFNFINSDDSVGASLNTTIDSSIDVPEFICKIINSKLSRYPHFKACDDSFISSDMSSRTNLPQEHPWVEFITSLNRNEDFIDLVKFNSA
jgi:hypothetical protein